MVDISGLDDGECHVQCQWQRVTEYVYSPTQSICCSQNILKNNEKSQNCTKKMPFFLDLKKGLKE